MTTRAMKYTDGLPHAKLVAVARGVRAPGRAA